MNLNIFRGYVCISAEPQLDEPQLSDETSQKLRLHSKMSCTHASCASNHHQHSKAWTSFAH